MRKLVYSIIYLWYRFLNQPRILMCGVSVGKNVHFRGKVFFKNAIGSRGSIVIGDNVNINSSLAADPIGGDTRTILYTRHKGKIIIEEGVGLSNSTLVSDASITIGAYTNIGGGTKIYDTDFHSLNPDVRLNGDTDIKSKPVCIGSRVFIGGHSIILKGVTIGDGVVIGAGSVVTKDIPPYEIWAGNPAKFVRKIFRNMLSAT